MWDIFKWFFGIVIVIIFAYFIVVAVRAVMSTTSSVLGNGKTSASTNFSVKDWFTNLYKPTAYTYVPGSVIVAGQNDTTSNNLNSGTGQYRNPIADKILNSYSKLDLTGNGNTEEEFDTRWGGGSSFFSDTNNSNSNQNIGKTGLGKEISNNTSNIQPNIDENSAISNNQVINGYADKSVYENRYFTVQILDQNKNVIGTIKAFINGDIRKDGTIPFRGVLSFNTPTSGSGYLNFNNENLLKIYFAGVRISSVVGKLPTIIFSSPVGKNSSCVVGGCNMQFCLEQNEVMNLVSSCQYLRAYYCYRQAVCERNTQTGKCGWRMDNNLAACLQNFY